MPTFLACPAAVEMLLEYGFFKMFATIVAQIIQGA